MTSIDLSEFLAENGAHGTRCSVAIALSALDTDRAAALRAALATPKDRLQDAAISRTLRKWGVICGRDAVARHRNQVCRCDR